MAYRLLRQCAGALCSRAAQRWLGQGLRATAGLLFPPVCVVCRRGLTHAFESILLCPLCRTQLSEARPCCQRCARPLPVGAGIRRHCSACRKSRFRFDGTTAVGTYGGLLRETVIRMKQETNDSLALSIGQLLAQRQQQHAKPDLIAPVPMHWLRRLTRGVNCPEVLGEVLGSRLGVPVTGDLLYCRRKARKQGILLPSERRANVRGAYAASRGYDIKGAQILLVDDVMTTGSTAHEIARVLVRAGAARVSVAVVARGVGFE